MYYCPTITARCDVFDPITKVWNDADTLCTDAPRERYRHTAVGVDNKVYLIGGVDGYDQEVKEIDVYDPSDGTWSVFGFWQGATTDLASFAVDKDIFIIGGYNSTFYEAQSAVWKMDTTATTFDLTEVASMKHPRGDIFAAASDKYVYVTGGFSHTNGFAAPLETVERWRLESTVHPDTHSQWERVANMTHGRADKALMHMNSRIYSIGGEKAGTVAIKDVEVFDEFTGVWTVKGTISDETFRFVAAAHEPTESIYIFGGQNYYDSACDCYKISKEVLRFVDKDWVNDNIDAGGPGSIASLSTMVGVVACACAAVFAVAA